jgi:Gram-negative bacterial TonB protein C-terminal
MNWKNAWIAVIALPLLCSSPLGAQQTSATEQPAAPLSDQISSDATATVEGQDVLAGPISNDDDLRRALTGKQLYIRELWLDDELHFNMDGGLVSNSPKGSFTLCVVQIDHVRLTKKRVELEGARYGIHFADAANWADSATSFDYLRVTPKKKHLTIIIDRELVVTPKKKKEGAKAAAANTKTGAGTDAAAAEVTPNPTPAEEAQPATGEEEAGKGETEATTTDPRKAAEVLRHAINRIFAPSLDGKMIAQMPDYWQYFYKAQMDHRSMEPTDPKIVRLGPGVNGPKLVKNLVAMSNDYAQRAQVAGVASYKVILDASGKPIGVAVYRPIGFGLDENAVAAIEKSTFSAATKDGRPVSTVIDMAVNFRIYSKRTAPPPPGATQQAADMATAQNISPVTGKPSLPGPYTVAQQPFQNGPQSEQPAPQP